MNRRAALSIGLAAALGMGTGRPRSAVATSLAVARLTWYGHCCFLLETPVGTRIVMDPLAGGLGYPLPQGLRAHAVTISHEQAENNNVALVTSKVKVLRGLTADKKGWVRIEEKVKEVSVRSVGVYRDENRGGTLGLNTVFVFEVSGVRIAHLGGLGHLLSDDHLSAIGSVDLVLVPVGGVGTIDGRQANRVIDQLHPRLAVIPMAFKTAVSTTKDLGSVEEFIADRPNAHLRRESGNSISINGVKTKPYAELVVLNYA